MIFKPVLCRRIIEGRKTITRRWVVHRDGRDLRYRAGREYAMQPGRGKTHVGHLEVNFVHVEPLGELSGPEARREGFPLEGPNTDDEAVIQFEDYWTALHGEYDPRVLVAVIAFRYAGRRECCAVLDA